MTEQKDGHKNYKGFVAGVFSGVAKLSGMSIFYTLFKQLLAVESSSRRLFPGICDKIDCGVGDHLLPDIAPAA
jgi:hypothetical protein